MDPSGNITYLFSSKDNKPTNILERLLCMVLVNAFKVNFAVILHTLSCFVLDVFLLEFM